MYPSEKKFKMAAVPNYPGTAWHLLEPGVYSSIEKKFKMVAVPELVAKEPRGISQRLLFLLQPAQHVVLHNNMEHYFNITICQILELILPMWLIGGSL